MHFIVRVSGENVKIVNGVSDQFETVWDESHFLYIKVYLAFVSERRETGKKGLNSQVLKRGLCQGK